MEIFKAKFPKINIAIKKGFFTFLFLLVKNKRLGVKSRRIADLNYFIIYSKRFRYYCNIKTYHL